MAKQTFTSGQVLTAQQMNDLQTNDFNMSVTTQTANYTLAAADKGTREVMNMATAGTVTVPNSTFNAGDAVWLHSIGSGTITVAAGAGLTLNSSAGTAPTLAQWEGGVVYFTSASAAIFFRSGSRNTLNVDFLLVGGGGGGGGGTSAVSSGGGGGGAGGFVTGSGIIGKTTYTVKVGASGSAGTVTFPGNNGTASSFIGSANGGAGGGSANSGTRGQVGASGGGGPSNAIAAGTGVSGEGNNGGAGGTQSGGGGGGAGGTGSAGSTGTGGAGGSASANSYTGSSISYSGGGGGGGSTAGGAAGTNAGAGGSGFNAGSNATANRGGGGGGGGGNGGFASGGGNGGSGEVVIRALTADAANFTITTTGSPTTNYPTGSGGYVYWQFTTTGSITLA